MPALMALGEAKLICGIYSWEHETNLSSAARAQALAGEDLPETMQPLR